MGRYQELADCYDAFTQDVKYSEWADFYESLFKRHNTKVESVLDLSCGTGTLSYILAKKGYEVIGVDASPEMLSRAMAKSSQCTEIMPLFLCQEMEDLDLYGTVDAAVSSLDSINYLDGPCALDKTLGRLKFFIRPGGLFLFDINTEHKFKMINGECFMRENDTDVCIWRSAYNEEEKRCLMMVDVFKKQGKVWARSTEEHEEYAFSESDIVSLLEKNGFSLEAKYDNLSYDVAKTDSMRIFYVARRNDL